MFLALWLYLSIPEKVCDPNQLVLLFEKNSEIPLTSATVAQKSPLTLPIVITVSTTGYESQNQRYTRYGKKKWTRAS